MLQVNDPVKVVKEMFEYASDEKYSNDGTSGEKQKKKTKGGSKGNPRVQMLTILTRRTTLTDHSRWPHGMCRDRTFTGECFDESE